MCDDSFKYSPTYRRDVPLVGYTGFFPKGKQEDHELDSSISKKMIRGYTGFRPYRRDIIGSPIIPSLEKQEDSLSGQSSPSFSNSYANSPMSSTNSRIDSTATFNFRSYGNHLDIAEKYQEAIESLKSYGQSQEMLLRIVQSKTSERVHSYSSQMMRTRRLFEMYDHNKDGALDQGEFRQCLEKLNIQFDDLQVLALFALFDTNNDGFIEYEDFADYIMVSNPQGGTAVMPKIITQVDESHPTLGKKKFTRD